MVDLRQRKGWIPTANNDDPILPLYGDQVGQPIRRRRKRIRRHGGGSDTPANRLVVGIAAATISIFLLAWWNSSLPSESSTEKKHRHRHTHRSDNQKSRTPLYGERRKPRYEKRSDRKKKEEERPRVPPFKCKDGRGTGFLNDDYCDCLDGSDEPLTSACSRILVQIPTFECGDEAKTIIFASRVHDGVVDCPNGNDETIKSAAIIRMK